LKRYVIIVAGGTGTRMQSFMPKQFLDLCGKPILMRSINTFVSTISQINVIVVLPESHINLWKALCKKYNFNIPHKICSGGETRFHSVKNGLSQINEAGVVAIHDAVRPLVSAKVILRCFKEADKYGCAIPVVPIKDTLRFIVKNKSYTQKRDNYKTVQTPQCFRVDIIKKAYSNSEYNEMYTDDASVVEKQGFKVRLVEGNDENIKITTPLDLIVAEAIKNHQSKK